MAYGSIEEDRSSVQLVTAVLPYLGKACVFSMQVSGSAPPGLTCFDFGFKGVSQPRQLIELSAASLYWVTWQGFSSGGNTGVASVRSC